MIQLTTDIIRASFIKHEKEALCKKKLSRYNLGYININEGNTPKPIDIFLPFSCMSSLLSHISHAFSPKRVINYSSQPV